MKALEQHWPWLLAGAAVLLYFGGRTEPQRAPVAAPAVPSGEPPRNDTMPAAFRDFVAPSLPGYSRMRQADVPSAVMPKLLPLLKLPLGTVTKVPTDGRDIVAVVEPHRRDDIGWHKGVSLFERRGANA